jgi:hypothetical protein
MEAWTQKLYGERLGYGNYDVLTASQIERRALRSRSFLVRPTVMFGPLFELTAENAVVRLFSRTSR